MDRYAGSPGVTPPSDGDELASLDARRRLVQDLARDIADAADADQWAVVVHGLEHSGYGGLQDLMPKWWLAVLDRGRPATHRITLPLRSMCQEIGFMHLESWKPGGFRDEELLASRRAAQSAADLLDAVLRASASAARPRPSASTTLRFVTGIGA